MHGGDSDKRFRQSACEYGQVKSIDSYVGIRDVPTFWLKTIFCHTIGAVCYNLAQFIYLVVRGVPAFNFDALIVLYAPVCAAYSISQISKTIVSSINVVFKDSFLQR